MIERKLYLDNLRGVLILLVMLGHSIQAAGYGIDDNFANRLIYSFHMPMFMAISGYLSYKIAFDSNKIISKAKQLLVPYVLWTVLMVFLYDNVSLQGAFIDESSLWFLWVLFIINLIYYVITILINKFKNKFALETMLMLVWLILVVLSNVLNIKVFSLPLIAWHFMFFCVGLIIKKHKIQMNNMCIIILLLIIWIVGAIICKEDFCQNICNGLPSGITHLVYLITKYTVAITAIFTLLSLFRIYLNCRISILTYLGSITMGLYTFSVSVEGLIFKEIVSCVSNKYIAIALCFVLISCLSVMANKLLESSKLTRVLCLGKNK